MGGINSIWIGFDGREAAAFAVARSSIERRTEPPIAVSGLVLQDLQALGLYTRPTEKRLGKLWDTISGAHCSTEFANSRFLVPHLARKAFGNDAGYALFMDCDMLVRTDIRQLFDGLKNDKAAYCVKHDFTPPDGVKMDGQPQVSYPRKLWSSFCVFNVGHPANRKLTLELINGVPGRELHALCWLEDDEIGELDTSWNWIVGHSPEGVDPHVVHFSEGGPWFTGFENVPFADEWRRELYNWAS